MKQLPMHVKQHWAHQLGKQPRDGKARTHIWAIKNAWPEKCLGWWDADSKELTMNHSCKPVEDNEYGELMGVFITNEEAEAVEESDLMEAFEHVR
jgi:hypothetical protein